MNEHEVAQSALGNLKQAVLALLKRNPEGLTNTQITKHLGLESDQNGKQRNYLAWSVLGVLMREASVVRDKNLYKASS